MERRILLLVTDLLIGGTPTVVRELAFRLARLKDVYVEVACLDRWGPVAQQLADGGVKVTALSARGPGDFTVFFRLARLIRRQRIDTVFSFLVHANAAATAARWLMFRNRPRLIQSIQTTQPYPKWHWRVQRAVGRSAEMIVVPSPSVAEAARQWAGVPEKKLRVIFNAVEPADYAELAAIDRTIGPANRIGFIGRLDPIKRVPDLIAAMPLLPPEVTLAIYGDGPERPAIEAAIAKACLETRVKMHGQIARPADALKAVDIIVLPSSAEGFGLVLIEAMAAGIPVIGTDVPGIRDVITNNQNGLLVPPGNPAELAKAINRLRETPALRAALILGGHITVANRFSWSSVMKEYREIMDNG